MNNAQVTIEMGRSPAPDGTMTLGKPLDFLLFDWLQVDQLVARSRFTGHSTETITAVLDLSEGLAQDKFVPYNRLVDIQEPSL